MDAAEERGRGGGRQRLRQSYRKKKWNSREGTDFRFRKKELEEKEEVSALWTKIRKISEEEEEGGIDYISLTRS